MVLGLSMDSGAHGVDAASGPRPNFRSSIGTQVAHLGWEKLMGPKGGCAPDASRIGTRAPPVFCALWWSVSASAIATPHCAAAGAFVLHRTTTGDSTKLTVRVDLRPKMATVVVVRRRRPQP